MKEFFNKVWLKLNGNKTLIGSISMVALQSSFVEARVEPDLLSLLFNASMLLFGVGGGHKVLKKFQKK